MRPSIWLGCFVLIILGCRSDKLVEPVIPDPANIYWSMDINHPTVMLSVQKPYDTVQLVTTPVNVYGDPIPTEQKAVYRKLVGLDTAIRVDSTGFVTAHYATGVTSRIEVTLQVGNHAKIDTVLIMVRNDASVRFIDSVRLRPDSSWRWRGYDFGAFTNWGKVYAGTSEVTASQRLISYSYDNPELIECTGNTGIVNPCDIEGETYIRVTMYAYGRMLSDSVFIRRIGAPVKVVVFKAVTRPDGSQDAGFFPGELRIQKGNTVFFVNRVVRPGQVAQAAIIGKSYGNIMKTFLVGTTIWGYADSVDIVFDDPSKISAGASYVRLSHTIELYDVCTLIFTNCFSAGNPMTSDGISGNIPAFGHVWNTSTLSAAEADKGLRSRRFNEVGEFHYTSTRFPSVTGTIIVTE